VTVLLLALGGFLLGGAWSMRAQGAGPLACAAVASLGVAAAAAGAYVGVT
jgi:hypothetical protein